MEKMRNERKKLNPALAPERQISYTKTKSA